MMRTNVTLQPSKRIVTLSAAQIYAAYVAAGHVQPEASRKKWIERSVREAVAIAQYVEHTVQSDDELPDDGKQRLRDLPDDEEVPDISPPG